MTRTMHRTDIVESFFANRINAWIVQWMDGTGMWSCLVLLELPLPTVLPSSVTGYLPLLSQSSEEGAYIYGWITRQPDGH